jgi:hypothetical protein
MDPAVVNKVKRPQPGMSKHVDEVIESQIAQYRLTAQAMGDAALEAIDRGDVGLARTTARQAAQGARVALQLETGERDVEGSEFQNDRFTEIA